MSVRMVATTVPSTNFIFILFLKYNPKLWGSVQIFNLRLLEVKIRKSIGYSIEAFLEINARE